MKAGLYALAAFLLASNVDAHAVLLTLNGDVKPWNVKESTKGPCGGGVQPTAVVLRVDPGATIQGNWAVNAGDGVGNISAKFDGAAGTAFATATTLTMTGGNPTAVLKTGYGFTLTAPALGDCTGVVGDVTNVCNVQIRSTSNWYSCVTFALNGPPPPTPVPIPAVPLPTCSPIAGATFCAGFNGKNAIFQPGVTAAQLDTIAADTYKDAYQNTLVFRAGDSTTCKPLLTDSICADIFQACDPAAAKAEPKGAVCNTRCRATASGCSLDPSHQGVYGCDPSNAKYTEKTSDILGACNTVVIPPPVPVKPMERAVEWTNTKGPYDTLYMYGGDTLNFKYTVGMHDVWQFPTKLAYDNCDFTGAVEQPPSVLLLGDSGSKYYGCKYTGHCAAGQKVEVSFRIGGVCTPAMNALCTKQGLGPCDGQAECTVKAGGAGEEPVGGVITPPVTVDNCAGKDCQACLTEYQSCSYCRTLTGDITCTNKINLCATDASGRKDVFTNFSQCAAISNPLPSDGTTPTPSFVDSSASSVVASVAAIALPLLALLF